MGPMGPGGAGASASEEELRAAYEAEIKKIRIEQVLLEQVVTLINLGMRRTGLSPDTEDERDLGQVQLAIESVRVLLPLVEQIAPPQGGQIRDALSQLQLAFVRLGGAGAAPGGAADRTGVAGQPGAGGPEGPGGPGAPNGPGGPAGGPSGPGAGQGRPGGPPPGGPPPAGPDPGGPQSEEAGPAQRSGRLWIPGQ